MFSHCEGDFIFILKEHISKIIAKKKAIIASIPSGEGEIIQLWGTQGFLFCDQVTLSAHLALSSVRIMYKTMGWRTQKVLMTS